MRTRLAPSPTGDLHLGHARAFLAAWCLARSQGGQVLLRIEDLDAPRVVAGAAQRQMADMQWLGLDWDAAPVYQSGRTAYYNQVLAQLAASGHVHACYHSRQDVARAATAPHGLEGVPPYPIALRPNKPLAPADIAQHPEAALRFWVRPGVVGYTDMLQGHQQQDVLAEVGEFVLRRRDGHFAYQLACVADDIAQGITHVVRGADLLHSTPRQLQLWQALGVVPPAFAHVGLVVNAAREKLSKRDAAVTLAELRSQGINPQEIVGWLAASLGYGVAGPITANDLANGFELAPAAALPWRPGTLV